VANIVKNKSESKSYAVLSGEGGAGGAPKNEMAEAELNRFVAYLSLSHLPEGKIQSTSNGPAGNFVYSNHRTGTFKTHHCQMDIPDYVDPTFASYFISSEMRSQRLNACHSGGY